MHVEILMSAMKVLTTVMKVQLAQTQLVALAARVTLAILEMVSTVKV